MPSRDLLMALVGTAATAAALSATLAGWVGLPAKAPDPWCELSHQSVHLDADFDMVSGKHQLTFEVDNVCDRYKPLPPPSKSPWPSP